MRWANLRKCLTMTNIEEYLFGLTLDMLYFFTFLWERQLVKFVAVRKWRIVLWYNVILVYCNPKLDNCHWGLSWLRFPVCNPPTPSDFLVLFTCLCLNILKSTHSIMKCCRWILQYLRNLKWKCVISNDMFWWLLYCKLSCVWVTLFSVLYIYK